MINIIPIIRQNKNVKHVLFYFSPLFNQYAIEIEFKKPVDVCARGTAIMFTGDSGTHVNKLVANWWYRIIRRLRETNLTLKQFKNLVVCH